MARPTTRNTSLDFWGDIYIFFSYLAYHHFTVNNDSHIDPELDSEFVFVEIVCWKCALGRTTRGIMPSLHRVFAKDNIFVWFLAK